MPRQIWRLAIRNVNMRVYKRFKQRALESDMSVGVALTEAMESWVERKTQKAI